MIHKDVMKRNASDLAKSQIFLGYLPFSPKSIWDGSKRVASQLR